MTRAPRPLVAAAALATVAAACSRGKAPEPARDELVAQVASYDLAFGEKTRFIVGLLTRDSRVVGGGTAEMRFSFLGKGKASGRPRSGPTATGAFLPIPKEKEEHRASPGAPELPEGIGVYSAQVLFDRAGFWEVEVEREGKSGTASFEVLQKHKIPAVGDEAPRTENLTTASADAPLAAIDSRAAIRGAVPDPELHSTTIKAAIEAARPVLVVFSTPVYCLSRFCGPVTDTVQELAATYADRAAFIHVEIWRDNPSQTLNRAAADWLLRDGDLQEPWVFLIASDGRIAARWDNVATRGEIEPLLQALPAR